MHKIFYAIPFFLCFSFTTLYPTEKARAEILKEETLKSVERSFKIAAQFYSLEPGEDTKEITETILQSSQTNESTKQSILDTGRRFFLFTYPSDGLLVKGYLSFVPDSLQNPLLLFLRGGNRMLGLMHPASEFTCSKNYTVLATAYRGGVSEGIDEFGGNDVHDVHNLLEYFPILQEKLDLHFLPSKTFLLGGSRGGMEMFLAMGRSSSFQSQITKAASLSGLLDIRECMAYREDMRGMFINDFGLIPEVNEEEWIASHDPLNHVSKIRKDLPILILQGTNDLRVSLKEGHHMVEALEKNGNPVTYVEIQGGDHCLANQPNRMELITNWFEKEEE